LVLDEAWLVIGWDMAAPSGAGGITAASPRLPNRGAE
jgi:hypothetical protein